jgi:hypothetical protein
VQGNNSGSGQLQGAWAAWQPRVWGITYVPGFWSVKGFRETVLTLIVGVVMGIGYNFRLLLD